LIPLPVISRDRCRRRTTITRVPYTTLFRSNDCWLGANVVVCPGVTIGDNCVIGAGSVVVKDIPSNSFAAGNPCRVIREITEQESMKHKPEILDDNRIIE